MNSNYVQQLFICSDECVKKNRPHDNETIQSVQISKTKLYLQEKR